MTATTESIATVTRSDEWGEHPVAAATTLFGGTLVCRNADGNLVDGADTANLRFAGVLDLDVDNSDGAAGDLYGRVTRDGQALLTGAGFTAADVGKQVYLVDNQTVGLGNTALTQFHPVGTIVQYVSATKVWVELAVDQRPEPRQFVIELPGTAPGALDIAAQATQFGGSGFYVRGVQSVVAFVAATNASAGRKAVTTNYTVAAGSITLVTDESANKLVIAFTANLL